MSSQKPFKRQMYDHNPIQEAIFEIKCPVDSWDSSVPGRFYERVRDSFPVKSDVQSMSFVFRSSGPPSTPVQAPIMKIRTKDRRQTLQIGPGILTANCLEYSSWPAFRDTIEQATQAYLEVTTPSTVNSLSIRYINRFEFEEPAVKIFDYFVFGILIPETIQDLNGFQCTFHNQVEAVNGLAGWRNTTRFFTRPTKDPLKRNLIFLDIKTHSLGTIETKRDAILRTIEHFHDTVEKIFESFITDTMRARLGVKDV